VIRFITHIKHYKFVMAVLTFTSGGIFIHKRSLKALVALSSFIAALAVGGTGCDGVRH
jgi:ABC-type xylose transport system permease subunit